MVKVDAVLYREASCLGTAEGCQEGTAVQGTTDVACQGSDVSTLTANHTDACRLLLIVVIGEFDFIHTHGLRLQLHLLACSAQGIRAVTIHLHGTIGRRDLLNLANKLLQHLLYQLTGDVLGWESMVYTVLLIVACRGSTQLKRCRIFLGMCLQLLNLLGTFTRTEHQHTRSKGIERTGMSYLHLEAEFLAEQIANVRQCSKARHAIRLVDVAAFCRLAQKNGMYVIVRPGPYVCAEWEMGGLPWWLLKKKDIRLREQDPYFMQRVEIFEKEVGKQLAPLTIQNGGPIIMVQVENEYGSYGKDKPYVSAIRDIVRKSGFDKVSLFQCDWSSNFLNNGLEDLTWTMNFGTGANIDQQFKRLGEVRPNAPKMCSEFWSGWFDKWGARHETRPAKDMVEGMDEMLSKGISFSLYMTHGGTSFGHWAGANSPGFQPDVTSYDYDAPINEYGHTTPKYFELREMMAKHNDGKKLPAVPKAPMPLVSVPTFKFTEYKPLIYGYTKKTVEQAPKTFEEYDMGWGTMTYVVSLPANDKPSTLTGEFHDFALVYLDNKYIGKIDRVKNEKSLDLPAMPDSGKLTIVVEGMGRINFGRAIKDYKGIVGNVTITSQSPYGEITLKPTAWTQLAIPDDYQNAVKALSGNSMADAELKETVAKAHPDAVIKIDPWGESKAGYYRGYFNLKKVGDTFINMEAFGKGQVYVNGHALGRFWQIGPQQTLYLPGCWLKKGKNEVIVLDVVGPKGEAGKPGSTVAPTAFCQDHPELDKLNLEKSNKHNEPGHRMDLNSETPVLNGEFKAGNGWQTIKLDKPVTGRYFAIQAESSQSGDSQIAIAEVYLQDAQGNRIDRNNWVAYYADSEKGNSTLDKMFDLQESTYWQTEKGANFPHLGIVDMGKEVTISAFEYLPRAEQGAPGSVKGFKLYVRK